VLNESDSLARWLVADRCRCPPVQRDAAPEGLRWRTRGPPARAGSWSLRPQTAAGEWGYGSSRPPPVRPNRA